MIKVAHILGDWSRNIGNSFFQLGGQWVINKVLPNADIMLINEQPGYPSYWNFNGGNPEKFLDLSTLIDVDYLVLMGPLFREETEKIWGKSLERYIANGTRIIFLGIGAMNYEDQNIKNYRNFLKRFKPYVFISRDHETFEKLGDLATYAYDGIDFGFFMTDVYKPLGFNSKTSDFIALNFDKTPEPYIRILDNNSIYEKSKRAQYFEYNNLLWELKFPYFRTWLAKQSRQASFLEGFLFGGNNSGRVGKYNIIRTDHRPHPLLRRKTYRYPNVVVSDTPYIYAEIYNAASLTLTNRVHACVLALSYGRPAMLFSETPRLRLLERLGLEGFTKNPVTLDKKKIKKEKLGIIDFLEKVFTK